MLLPTGLVGLLVASVIAAVQSSVDALMVTAAGILTRNIYNVYLVKDKTEKHYLLEWSIVKLFIKCFFTV